MVGETVCVCVIKMLFVKLAGVTEKFSDNPGVIPTAVVSFCGNIL